jgi:cytochrome b561
MTIKPATKYPASVIFFHTVIGLLMIATLIFGWLLEENPDLEDWHKALGIAILFLGVIRMLNRLRTKPQIPASLNAKGTLQFVAEKTVHGLLYLVMFSTPLLGWLLVSAQAEPIGFFGLFEVPALMAENESLTRTLKNLHELSANVFFGLVLLHVAGALLHHIKHKGGVFKRIMPF